MRRGLLLPVLIACSVLLLAAGCGSSSSSSTRAVRRAAQRAARPAPRARKPRLRRPESGHDAEVRLALLLRPVQSGLVQIAYRNIAIDPDTVRVKVGSTIKWTNNDPEKCNVTSQGGPYKFSSGDFGEGGTFN